MGSRFCCVIVKNSVDNDNELATHDPNDTFHNFNKLKHNLNTKDNNFNNTDIISQGMPKNKSDYEDGSSHKGSKSIIATE